METFHGRLALVTGASSGLGRAFAERYAALGADVMLVARRKDRLEDIAHGLEAACDVRAFAVAQDLSVTDCHVPILNALTGLNRTADILVNNAGFSIPDRFADTGWARQQAFVGTLVTAVAALTHACLPEMRAHNWGRIINVSSMLAYAPGGAGHTLYPAAKAFVLRFSQSLHHELHGSGVHCTATCPGTTATDFKLANGTARTGSATPGFLVQTPEEVVRGALAANARNKAVHVPGWHNKLAVSVMQLVPDEWMAPSARRAGDQAAD